MALVNGARFLTQRNEEIHPLNKTVRHVTTTLLQVQFPPVESNNLWIVGYSDAAFAKNHELSSHLSCIIMLVDDRHRTNLISIKSYKSWRITGSIIAAEIIQFSDLLGEAFATRSKVEQAFGKTVALYLLIDSNSLFDIK